MLNTANGAGAGKPDPRFDGGNAGGAKAGGPKVNPLREAVDRVRAKGGDKLEAHDISEFIAAMFKEVLTPRPGREHHHLTPERSEAIEKMAAGMQRAMGEVIIDHGPDKALPLLLATAITTLVVELDHHVQPGLIRATVRSLASFEQAKRRDDPLEELLAILTGGSRIPSR